MKQIYFISFFLLQAFFSYSQTIRSSISNRHINAFSQDDQGYIWIATAKGLCRYDGYEYKIFYNEKGNANSLPSDNVNDVYVDSRNKMWLTTNSGICRYNPNDMSFVRYPMMNIEKYCLGIIEYGENILTYGLGGIYKIDEQKCVIESCLAIDGQVINSLTVDKKNNLWCTYDKTILCFDASFNLLRKLNLDVELYCSFICDDGDILFGTKAGFLRVNSDTYDIDPFSYPGEMTKMQIKIITSIGEHILLIGTKNQGVLFYDTKENRLISSLEMNMFTEVKSNEISCSFIDKDHNVWLGTFDDGFIVSTENNRVFNTDKKLYHYVYNKFVTRIVEDEDHNLWIGTRYGGLIGYNTHTGIFTEYNSSTFKSFSGFTNNFVQSLFIDGDNRIWIGYDNSLIICRLNGGRIFLLKSYEEVGDVVTITEDANHRIWTGSSIHGITVYNSDMTKYTRLMPSPGTLNNITKIISLSDTKMLFSSYMDNVYTIDINTLRPSLFSDNPDFKAYGKNAITLYENGNYIWIGTYGNGLCQYDKETHQIKSYSLYEGLESDDILSLVEDDNHTLWMSTSFGLSKMELKSGDIQTFLASDGTGGDQFHEKCALKRQNGEIMFGGNHGITEVLPCDIKTSSHQIPVLLEDLKIFNHSIHIGDNDRILDKHISRMNKIVLNHKQNVFSLDFVGLAYDAPQRTNYAYKLEGFDKEWNYVGNFRRASYSNLPAGDYIFEVKAQNRDGVWSDSYKLLSIQMLPAPWLHPSAIVLYIVTLIAIIYGCVYIYVKLKLGKERLIMAEKKVDREKALTQMKINFFTNVSHELRTPLTMVCAPVKLLMEEKKWMEDRDSAFLLGLINNNVERLLKLIDQLLDFDKIVNNTLLLRVSKNDIIQQVKIIIDNYRLYATEKKICIQLECQYNELMIMYDVDKMDKIINNLLFNAMKYTNENGHVKVRIELTKEPDNAFNLPVDNESVYLQISVEDDGIGIDNDDMKYLFERFKRLIHDEQNALSPGGSGIGLNYVKCLVENHKGHIVAKRGEEKGMTFIFILPMDDDAYVSSEYEVTDDNTHNVKPTPDLVTSEETEMFEHVDESADSPSVLVVEDHAEMRMFIRHILRVKYHVITACDGNEGYEKALDCVPDIVISDILMPNMNGYELCGKIKEDSKLCHIPVVLLTAKTMEKDHIEGYLQGADIYLNKPFTPPLLLSVIKNIFANRERQKHLLLVNSGNEDKQEDTVKQELNPLDQRFMNKLYDYINSNLSNSDLNVNLLGRELGFSRTNFYRKVKALTGTTPTDFLRVYRLNRAAELILKEEYSFNEISEMAGFGTQSHFSTSFKKHFGMTPKEYKDKYSNFPGKKRIECDNF